MKRSIVYAAAVISLSAAIATSASAQTAEQFYAGKRVTLIIASSAGGAYDTLARTVARHLPKHIPGNPVVVPQNLVGAGGIRSANHLYTIAPRDGSVIGLIQNSTAFQPMLGAKEATYDATRFNWLGTPSVEVGLIALWHSSPVNTLNELRKRETTIGSSGVNSTPSFFARLLNEVFGTKMKIVSGYPGLNEVYLAMERGEVEGYPVLFYSSLMSTKPDWLRDRKIKLIMQFGFSKEAALPDVPFGPDLVTRPEDKELMQAAFASLAIGRPFLAPPDTPADRVAALRKAFADVFADKDFLQEADKLQLGVTGPQSGEQIQTIIAEAYKASPDVIARLRRLSTQ